MDGSTAFQSLLYTLRQSNLYGKKTTITHLGQFFYWGIDPKMQAGFAFNYYFLFYAMFLDKILGNMIVELYNE